MSSAIELRQINNLASGLDIFLSKRGKLLEAIEYGPQSIVVQVPRTKLVINHLISLSGHLRLGDERFKFEATGKILLAQDDAEEGLTRILLHLSQVDKVLWGRFLSAHAAEQARVDKLLAAIKGED